MLFCEGCDCGTHVACAKFKAVPKGEWLCPSANKSGLVYCSPVFLVFWGLPSGRGPGGRGRVPEGLAKNVRPHSPLIYGQGEYI